MTTPVAHEMPAYRLVYDAQQQALQRRIELAVLHAQQLKSPCVVQQTMSLPATPEIPMQSEDPCLEPTQEQLSAPQPSAHTRVLRATLKKQEYPIQVHLSSFAGPRSGSLCRICAIVLR